MHNQCCTEVPYHGAVHSKEEACLHAESPWKTPHPWGEGQTGHLTSRHVSVPTMQGTVLPPTLDRRYVCQGNDVCLCSPFFFLLMVSCVQNTAIDIYHLQSDNPPPPLTWHTAITFPLSICSLSLRRAQTAPQLTSWNSRSYLWLLSLSIISVSHSQNAPLSTSKHLGS